jgi:uncharacterized membrane protein
MGGLISVSFYGSRHQGGFLRGLGYAIAAGLSMPIVMFFGHDRNVPTIALIAMALFETLVLSLVVFVVLSMFRRRKSLPSVDS